MLRANVVRFGWVLALVGWPLSGAAQTSSVGRPSDDRTLCPYFEVEGGVAGVDLLPLAETHVDVHVSGVIADVVVRQVYQNQGPRPIHARYVFPASTRAAVNGLRMRIGSRVVEAVIRERKRARAEYQRARAQGRNAALLEQARPNVFDMRVANIMPGDRIEVELRYTEILVPEDGTYEFVFPTVVGPRYTGSAADGEARVAAGSRSSGTSVVSLPGAAPDAWPATAYTAGSVGSPERFDINVVINEGMPLRWVRVPSHKVDVVRTGDASARVSLDPTETHGADRDYILRYRLADTRVMSGLTVHRGERGNYFMLMVEPPERITPEQIPPREFIFVMDVSGSMRGFPLETSKELMAELVRGLGDHDSFNVLLFSGASQLFAPRSVPATPENVDRALRFVDAQQGGGGTELPAALERALDLPRRSAEARTVVVATDGYISAERDAFRIVADHRGDANVFAFGIGASVNRYLVEGLARAGMSEPFVVTSAQEAPEVAKRFRAYVSSPVLTGVHLDFQGLDVYDVEPASIPDVLADRPVVVVGKFRDVGGVTPAGSPTGSVTLRGVTGAGAYTQTFDLAHAPLDEDPGLAYLWARRRITALSDPALSGSPDDAREEITQLGLRYGLLTAYTSFVAVDRIVRNPAGGGRDVQQPQALPHGMESLTNQESVEVASEPPLLLLLAGLLVALTTLRWLATGAGARASVTVEASEMSEMSERGAPRHG